MEGKCNIVLVKYDPMANMLTETRLNRKPLAYKVAEAKVKQNKQPLYFYVIGSQDTAFYAYSENRKVAIERRKIKD